MTRPACRCGHRAKLDEHWDAYFCPACGDWLESPCPDPHCEYCGNRPARPPLYRGRAQVLYPLHTRGHTHNWREVAEQEYFGAKARYARVLDRFTAADPAGVERLNAAFEERETARERWLREMAG